MLLLTRYWREALSAALFAICIILTISNVHKSDQLRLCKQERAADQASWRAATEKARADDLANAKAVETRNATIAEESQRDLESKLAAARAAAADAIRLRSQTDRSGGRVSHLPETAKPASGVVGAGETPIMDADTGDAIACAEGVTKAQGWLDWWRAVSADQTSATVR